MKASSLCWYSEDHIQSRRKADPKLERLRSGKYMNYGYGICTKNDWITKGLD